MVSHNYITKFGWFSFPSVSLSLLFASAISALGRYRMKSTGTSSLLVVPQCWSWNSFLFTINLKRKSDEKVFNREFIEVKPIRIQNSLSADKAYISKLCIGIECSISGCRYLEAILSCFHVLWGINIPTLNSLVKSPVCDLVFVAKSQLEAFIDSWVLVLFLQTVSSFLF